MLRLILASILIAGVPDPLAAEEAAMSPVPGLMPSPPKAYDPAPFREGLSAPILKDLARRLPVPALSDLPLYQMEIALDASAARLQGHLELLLTNTFGAPLPDVVLRTYPNSPHLVGKGPPHLILGAVTVNGTRAKALALNPTAFRIPLPGLLPQGERVRVGVDFQVTIPKLPQGSSINPGSLGEMIQQLQSNTSDSGYGIFATGDGVFNLGFFYPILPARVAGDWDAQPPAGMGDPANFDVANYLVKLKLPKLMQVGSTGIAVGDVPLGPGPEHLREVHLLATAVRNFALQLSTRYQVKEGKAGAIRVRALYVEGHEQTGQELLEQTCAALKSFESMFGPYPYPKLDVAEAALVGGAGGMEYPGLITVALSLNPAAGEGDPMAGLVSAFLRGTKTGEFVVAHEVAHQWWHALVGSDSTRFPFLDEGLANFSPLLYFDSVHGGTSADQQLELELAMPYQFFRLMGGQDAAVDRPVSGYSSQLEYAALIYGKGGMFFHALHQALGHQTFLKVLRAYATRFGFRQATPADLEALAASVSGQPQKVKALFQRWLRETHGDEDIGKLDLGDLSSFLGQMQGLQSPGLHNFKIEGMDPAMMDLFQKAVQGLSGP